MKTTSLFKKRIKEQGSIMPIVAGVVVTGLVGVTGVYAYQNLVVNKQNTQTTQTSTVSQNTQTSSKASTGNTGTLKVHKDGSPSGTEDNQPKVCKFNFEGFSFSSNVSGLIKITPQGGDNVRGNITVDMPFGPTDQKGYAQTDYVNLNSDTPLANGLYKTTLYGKDAKGNYTVDLKAKSKVFEVDCPVSNGE